MKTPTLSAIQAAPVCDVDATHGEMQAEHIHHIDGTINNDFGMYWFCPVRDCNGYAGAIKKESHMSRHGSTTKPVSGQMELFEEG